MMDGDDSSAKEWSNNPLVAQQQQTAMMKREGNVVPVLPMNTTQGDESHEEEEGGEEGVISAASRGRMDSVAMKRSTYKESIKNAGEILYDDMVYRKGFKRFSYDLYCQSWFWVGVSFLCIMEPVLCSIRKPGAGVGINYFGQCLVLALSTALLVFQIAAEVFTLEHYNESWSKRITDFKERCEAASKQGSKAPQTSSIWNFLDGAFFQLHLPMLVEVTTTGAIFLESVCIFGGWVFIYYRPGISALRCFRVLRILYYHQLPRSTIYNMESLWYASPLLRGVEFQLVEKACKFASQSLSNLTQEMFFLTHKTRGGFVLMFLLFYTAFVVGMSVYHEVWNDTTVVPDPNSRTGCNSVFLCTVIMLRLSFYDGSGLDFLTNLSDNHKFLFAVTVIYLCATAFGIFNGLIGVFGAIFNHESQRQFVLEADLPSLILGYKIPESKRKLLGSTSGPKKDAASAENQQTKQPKEPFRLHPTEPFQVGDVVVFKSFFDGNLDYGLAGAWDGRVAIVKGVVQSYRYPTTSGERQRARSRASTLAFDTSKNAMVGWTYSLRFVHKAGQDAPVRFRIETGTSAHGEEEEQGDVRNPYPGRSILHVLHNTHAGDELVHKEGDRCRFEDDFQALSGTLDRVDPSLQDRLKLDYEDRLKRGYEDRLTAVESKLDEILSLLKQKR